jgi:2-keto-3-deoxy-L-rhamnonate aldolase RhmA
VGNQLFQNLAAGRSSMGVGITMPSVEVVDAYGKAGWDLFYANMHSSRIEWHDVYDMVRAAGSWGITPCARIPMQPWVGGDNPVLAVDAHRAYSLGASVVMASVRGSTEARYLVDIARVEEQRLGRELLAIPAIETAAALDAAADLLAVSGLRMVFLGVSDLARELGMTGLDEPRMWELVRSLVDSSHAQGVRVAVNVGYPADEESAWQLSVTRAHSLCEIGVDVVFAVPAEEFLYGQARQFVKQVRARQ